MKMYPLSDSIVFNALESMPVKLLCLQDKAIEKNNLNEFNYYQNLIDELRVLAKKVEYIGGRACADGKTYGRLKEISINRQYMRYSACVSNGMSENKAKYAFI